MTTDTTLCAQFSVVPDQISGHSELVGNDPREPGGWDEGADGHQVLSIQFENPISQVGNADSYTFFSGAEPEGFTGPFNFNTYILRPTGNADEYSILFDSGTLEGENYSGVVTIAIDPPVEVEPGDLIGHWGRGIAFDVGTTGEDTWYYNLDEFGISKPSGTFTAVAPGYTPNGFGDREYALAFNVQVPEPSSLALGLAGVALLGAWTRKRRGASRSFLRLAHQAHGKVVYFPQTGAETC